MMKKATALHAKWSNSPEYRAAHGGLAEEFDLACALIGARSKAGMSQKEVADRMNTSQSFVARLEGGDVQPTWKSIRRYAEATGSRVKIELEHVKR